MRTVSGLHHVTAIAGAAQANLDFYVGVLGMRLVKRSVNQDDPGTYHLFFADAAGHPGTDLTFFPWSHAVPGRFGWGLSVEVALAIPPGSLDFWRTRLTALAPALRPVETRFGQATLPVTDPHGLHLALVETPDAPGREITPWNGSPVPPDHQIRGLAGARLIERELQPTTSFLADVLGFTRLGAEDGWERWLVGGAGPGHTLDLQTHPAARRGSWGVGSIHHLAWRVDNDEHQAEIRRRIVEAGGEPTPVIDRFWFHSVYFREPGGVLFELATDGPGFGVDEDLAHLGETLVLPPWLESHRAEIESSLPPLALDTAIAHGTPTIK
jgi:glyoxalase family protein